MLRGRERGKGNPPGRKENYAEEIFSSGGGNLTRSDFDHLNPFQSYKQHSVNTERL